MPPRRLDWLLETARTLPRRDPCPDTELLARFLDEGDESAFEALLERHSGVVRAACRCWLRSAADIDDAAQATFLVLVRRAHSIRNRAVLGRWLYRVANNVARRLHQQQRRYLPLPEEVPGREVAADDGLRDLLAEEVARLPEKYRLPVQLCYAAGLTTLEAAQRLGWPKGTVLTRLAWARQRLQQCLLRRGVTPVVFAGLVGTLAAPAVKAEWPRRTAQAALGALAGKSLDTLGVSEQTITLTKGVVRAMFHDRLKYLALAVLLAVGLTGWSIHRWATAADGPENGRRAGNVSDRNREEANPRAPEAEPGKEPSDPPAARPAPNKLTPRRREAVIRLPAGTFVKEVEAAPFGSGRLTWTYEEERVLGLIEGSAMGFEFELATEAEYSLSSTGTIYGVLTSVRLNHLKPPDGEKYAELKPYLGLWSAVEPLVNEAMTDLPFSYRFRVQDDRLVISNFRILLAGPNPLGKLGPLTKIENDVATPLLYFQALGTALEGTYTAVDPKEKPAPGKRPAFQKPANRFNLKSSHLKSSHAQPS